MVEDHHTNYGAHQQEFFKVIKNLPECGLPLGLKDKERRQKLIVSSDKPHHVIEPTGTAFSTSTWAYFKPQP